MLSSRLQSLLADREGTFALIRRLLPEHAAGRWKRYALAFALMAVTSACTVIPAYLVKEFVNETNIRGNFHFIVVLGLAAMVLYMLKGASTYGHTVVLARINSRVIADIQQRTFDKLLNQGLGYFADLVGIAVVVVEWEPVVHEAAILPEGGLCGREPARECEYGVLLLALELVLGDGALGVGEIVQLGVDLEQRLVGRIRLHRRRHRQRFNRKARRQQRTFR